MTHIETYVDCLKLLPGDFARDLALLQCLDAKTHSINQTIDQLQQHILHLSNDPNSNITEQIRSATSNQVAAQRSGSSSIPPIELVNHSPFLQLLHELREAEQEAYSLSLEKISVTHAIRESIVSYANRLEDETRQFETEMGPDLCKEAIDALERAHLKRSSTNQFSVKASASTKRPTTTTTSATKGDRLYMSRERDRDRARARDLRVQEEAMDFGAFDISQLSQRDLDDSTNFTDFAADEYDYSQADMSGMSNSGLNIGSRSNEEVFCFCRMPSFGDMVACDSPTCRFEWFHWSCVGLKKPPKGVWMCSDCRKKR